MVHDTTTGWSAAVEGGALTLGPVALGSLEPGQVEVEVEACGLCRSDLHLIDGTWRMGTYPLVPGHEAVGRVVSVGADVADVTVGDRVGVGWQCGACLDCAACVGGAEHLCSRAALTAVGRPGGAAERVRVDARFAVPIPDALSSTDAAPLLCAGASVYAPLARWSRPGGRVAILGLGGLGHLAVQYAARAFDCEVHVFTRSEGKAEDAARFGAVGFHAPDPKPHRAAFDLVLSTVDSALPWDRWIRALRPRGVLCMVGMPLEPVSFRAGPLLAREKTLTASNYASPGDVRAALEVAVESGVRPDTVVRPFAEAPAAFAALRAGDARYRMVLER